MTVSNIPVLLTDLQYPWSICSQEKREAMIKKLPYSIENLEYALEIFNESLSAVITMTEPEVNLIPEDEIENWYYSNEHIADSLSNFSDMNIEVIDSFIKKRKFKSESDHDKFREQILCYWIWFNINVVSGSSCGFTSKYLEFNRDDYIAQKFVNIFFEHWKHINSYSLRHWLGKVRHARSFAIPLMKEIEEQSTDEKLCSIAKSYEELIQWNIDNLPIQDYAR
jgi:hypothetical protein